MSENESKIYRIFLLEDDDVDAMSIERALSELMKFEITRFDCVQKALEDLKTNSYDCYILDYFLPDGTGQEVLEFIRSQDTIIPAVMFTDKGSEEIAVEAMKAGLSDYVVKSKMNEAMKRVLDLIDAGQQAENTLQSIRHKLGNLRRSDEDFACG